MRQVMLRFAAPVLLMVLSFAAVTYAQQPHTFREGLLLRLPEGYDDSPASVNPVEEMIVRGEWKSPEAGGEVHFPSGTAHWVPVQTTADGWFPDSLLDGLVYLFARYTAPSHRVMLLQGMGNDLVYVNGVPRQGNPYGYKDTWEAWEPKFDYAQLPLELAAGENTFLFRCSRGRLKAMLLPLARQVLLNTRAMTMPDAIAGKRLDAPGSVVIVNASVKPLRNVTLRTEIAGTTTSEQAPAILPLTVHPAAFRVTIPSQQSPGALPLRLSLLANGVVLDTATVQVRIAGPTESRRETFVSTIDGSVQYYAVDPPSGGQSGKKALIFSLHGASVEAINQANSYSPKEWAWIVAPTNRGPFGFNWEDWGRLDALEVLDRTLTEFPIDTSRVYLTGHSMGGHGTWQLGAHFADRFAAIGPSAGWITYWSYRIKDRPFDTTSAGRMFRRASATSETPEFIDNYNDLGIYVIHGKDDDNVPVQQSYMMLERLKGRHHDYVFHEQPGAGHWWDDSPEPGASCVDWPALFDFFGRHARPSRQDVRIVDFVTANPGVSSRNRWVTVAAQHEALKLSEVHLQVDPGLRRFHGTTRNVARLGLDLDVLPVRDSVAIDIDSITITGIHPGNGAAQLWLERHGTHWVVGDPPAPQEKNPQRYGTFKDAFRNRMIFVYGTKGTPEENRLLYERVRFDAEKFWYQGNGAVDIQADTEFTPASDPDRNVILYGNSETNLAWKALLKGSPVQVEPGTVRLGRERINGNDLCALFVRPREGSRTASVAAVAATGPAGIRLIARVPYFNAYLGLPDLTVLRASVLRDGATGVEALGFFGNDWSLEQGEFIGNAASVPHSSAP